MEFWPQNFETHHLAVRRKGKGKSPDKKTPHNCAVIQQGSLAATRLYRDEGTFKWAFLAREDYGRFCIIACQRCPIDLSQTERSSANERRH